VRRWCGVRQRRCGGVRWRCGENDAPAYNDNAHTHRHTHTHTHQRDSTLAAASVAATAVSAHEWWQPPLVLRWCVHEQGAALVVFTYRYPPATCPRRFRGRGVLLASRSSLEVVCGAERQLSGDRGHPLEAWRWCAVSAEAAMWCGGRRNDGERCVGVWRRQRRQAAAYTTHTSIQHTSAAVIRQGVAGVGV
jgi:hypothetical protein